MKQPIIYGSIRRYHLVGELDDEYEKSTSDALTHKPLKFFVKQGFFRERYPAWFFLVESTVGESLHYPMFEWDAHNDVYSILKEEGLSGHIYKTRNGYHVYGDGLMKLQEVYFHGLNMGCCKGYLEIAMKNKRFGLRCGRKEGRKFQDIQYVGHSSGLYVPKPRIVLVKDAIDSKIEQNYQARKEVPF